MWPRLTAEDILSRADKVLLLLPAEQTVGRPCCFTIASRQESHAITLDAGTKLPGPHCSKRCRNSLHKPSPPLCECTCVK